MSLLSWFWLVGLTTGHIFLIFLHAWQSLIGYQTLLILSCWFWTCCIPIHLQFCSGIQWSPWERCDSFRSNCYNSLGESGALQVAQRGLSGGRRLGSQRCVSPGRFPSQPFRRFFPPLHVVSSHDPWLMGAREVPCRFLRSWHCASSLLWSSAMNWLLWSSRTLSPVSSTAGVCRLCLVARHVPQPENPLEAAQRHNLLLVP